MTWGTTTLPEWLYTLIAGGGIVVSVYGYLDAVKVLNYLDALIRANHLTDRELQQYATDRIIARADIIEEAGKLAIHMITCGLGIYFLSVPPSDPDSPITRYGIILAAAFISKSLILVGLSVKKIVFRARALAMLIQHAIEDGRTIEPIPRRRYDVRPAE